MENEQAQNPEIQANDIDIHLAHLEINIERDLPLNRDIFRVLGTSRKTAVVAVTNQYIFRGCINHVSSERTLDVMNLGSLTEKERLPEDFLYLTDVDFFSRNGKLQRRVASCMLAKPNIYFVGELSIPPANSPDASPKHPLFQHKRPARVEILMPDLEMEASVHLCDWQQPMNVVDTIQRFLPLTRVKLTSPLITGESEFGFVAINRNLIIFMAEIPEESRLNPTQECPPATAPVVQSAEDSAVETTPITATPSTIFAAAVELENAEMQLKKFLK